MYTSRPISCQIFKTYTYIRIGTQWKLIIKVLEYLHKLVLDIWLSQIFKKHNNIQLSFYIYL